VIWFPQVGHCPSWLAIASVASSRDEQYTQLNPYRFPVDLPPSTPLYVRAAPPGVLDVPASETGVGAVAVGTRKVVEHVGHRTRCPAWASSAHNAV